MVRPAEIHFPELLCPIALLARKWRGGNCSLGQWHIVGQRGVRRKIRRVREAIEHERSHRILLVHWREPQDLFNGVQHAGLVVESADDLSPLRIGANYQTEGTMPVHMVITALRIILDHENDCVTAEDAPGNSLRDLSQGEVVISDLCLS